MSELAFIIVFVPIAVILIVTMTPYLIARLLFKRFHKKARLAEKKVSVPIKMISH